MPSVLQIGQELEVKIHRAGEDVRATINAQYRWLAKHGRLGNGLTFEENVREVEAQDAQAAYWALSN